MGGWLGMEGIASGGEESVGEPWPEKAGTAWEGRRPRSIDSAR